MDLNNEDKLITEEEVLNNLRACAQVYTMGGDKLLKDHVLNFKDVTEDFDKLIKRLKLFRNYYGTSFSFQDFIFYMGLLMESANETEGDFIFYRREKDNYMIEHLEGDTYTYDLALSATIVNNNFAYGEYLHGILVPKGTKINYIEDISFFPEDMELLLPLDGKLKFIEPKNGCYLWILDSE
ncbi:ADP-ribosyltransferase [Methanobrevibacter sp. DSM 116169]|uniref:ADP-ribosyltransferase n=1 Tax=Methanobrevibacter sp. DSM 116169 TaxID=3242727 RepID=UPI0038FC734A